MAEEEYSDKNVIGVAGRSSIACYSTTAIYRGVSAHAGAAPWEGVNALDALVAAYNNISMLRQQIRPDERIHGAVMQAPKITNAIPELTRTKYTIRSPTMKGTKALGERVRRCLEAGAYATGCQIELEDDALYADLIVNKPLSEGFRLFFQDQGLQVLDVVDDPLPGSTDQGNVSHIMPALHAVIGIPVRDNAKNHTRQFTAAAGTEEAHRRTVASGKAMAMTGWMALVDDQFYRRVSDAFAASGAQM